MKGRDEGRRKKKGKERKIGEGDRKVKEGKERKEMRKREMKKGK